MTVRKMMQAYASSDNRLAVFHLAVSLVMYVVALALGSWGFGDPLIMPAAILLFAGASIRIFGIQHDCGHMSYFSSRKVNILCGILLGAFTSNAFHAMRYNHNRHHANIGNLDRMEAHEVLTWTVAQYRDAGFGQRLWYRIYRSAPVIFVIGPILVIFLRYRFPKNARKSGLWDVARQNLLMAGLWAAIFILGGPVTFQFFLIAALTTACLGVIMVYVGHNHEETYWAGAPDYNFEEAALKGSSVIDLGPVFDFMTFNFAYHDLHHLDSRVPAYRLRACHIALSPHINPTRLGLWGALRCIRWKLWDSEKGRMVTFRDGGRSS